MEDLLNQIKLRTSLKALIGRDIGLKMRGREAVGLCPFHHEKTPSFHVIEDKQFYHCFGCGKSGTAINWLMEQKNLTFKEAVMQLAQDAGLHIPDGFFSTQKQQAIDIGLYDVMNYAAEYFIQKLQSPRGTAARQYLQKRNITPEMVEKFKLGFAPDGYDMSDLLNFMKVRHVKIDALAQVGIIAYSEKDTGKQKPYQRFRNRLIFPIADKRDRIIAFGGRALGDEVAKYINSPETVLFHKGYELYNQNACYDAIKKGHHLLVAEGYIDVIKLHQYGFLGAVAPLGTALTPEQFGRLWQMNNMPYLCFDGDRAGKAAAYRAAERALPILTPDKSCLFCFLPEKHDPDSLLEQGGMRAMEKLIERAMPLGEMLFQNVLQQKTIKTPEARAGLEQQLMNYVAEMRDPTVARHYRSFFKQRLWDTLRPPKNMTRPIGSQFSSQFGAQFVRKPIEASSRPARTPAMKSTPNEGEQENLIESLIFLFLHYPEIYPKFEEQFSFYGDGEQHDARNHEFAHFIAERPVDKSIDEINFLPDYPLLKKIKDKASLKPLLLQKTSDGQALDRIGKIIENIFATLDYHRLFQELHTVKRPLAEQEKLRQEVDLAWQKAFNENLDD